MTRLLLVVLVVLASVVSCSPRPVDDPTIVTTGAGAVRGEVDDAVRVFRAIPYAAPPVGSLRFAAPQPVPPWTGTRDATGQGVECPQPGHESDLPQKEDCLILNVTAPRHSQGKVPVLVWIHGGAFIAGNGVGYDARKLAAQGGIVVVTINYRLGTLGYLAALGLSDGIGNYGLLDQQAALRWVRENIAEFGGDPQQVTIAGQSAGAVSVCDLIAAPRAAGLFRSAIMQSAPCQAQAAVSTAVRDSAAYAAEVGCPPGPDTPRCLRALSIDALRDSPQFTGIGLPVSPVTGTPELPMPPLDAYISRFAASVPVLIGSNTNEATVFQAQQYRHTPAPQGPDEYRRALEGKYGAKAPELGLRYPLSAYGGNVLAALAAVDTDNTFACPTLDMAEALARSGPVYAYEFADPAAPAYKEYRDAPLPLGASHGSELGYFFDVSRPLNQESAALSTQMIRYWAQFVKTGDPNVEGQPTWPKYTAGGAFLRLAPPAPKQMEGFASTHQCGFWN
ncbi:carboxylesterase family protein [Mycobacterium sp. CBMA271]|uniref:carboxylesterase/lipase family protein n=1 Tax=unclassified Mycobacteroides TaxID=2618759 RepID=UPI0012DF438D|nr:MULTISPECIES: carboxylesterase family protein [unclassified Mycobacteroides]MUM18216.1 carboxylesterase [Mycobacteroides sp. CBMA 326]MUM20803.1 carboxylesterase family protein [Mycobacteroides sp. CBMA 271]